MALLDVQNLSKEFGGLRANDDISFSMDKGELLGLIGPNGAGKTTLFNCISGLHPVSTGRIIFDDEDITELKAHDVARLGLARYIRPPGTSMSKTTSWWAVSCVPGRAPGPKRGPMKLWIF